MSETKCCVHQVIISEPIFHPATPSNEIHEEYQQPKSTGANNRKKFDRRRTMALDDDVLVGRKTEKSKVIDLIGQPSDSDTEGRKVISVWGMGGLGKTTLVRSIYRSQQLGDWRRGWVTAPRPFNNEVLIRALVLQLLTDDPTAASEIKQKKLDQERTNLATMRLDGLREKLEQLLEKHKNCLIVLDDLSSIEEWNLVRDQLEKAKRIIVTTREHKVAKSCSGDMDMYIHQLQVLEQEEALALFLKKVLLNISLSIIPIVLAINTSDIT